MTKDEAINLKARIQSALDLLADATLSRDTWRDVSNVLHACRDAVRGIAAPTSEAVAEKPHGIDLDKLEALAKGIPEHIQLNGWYVDSPRFGQQFVYADDFRGTGRQHIASLPANKGYFGTMADFIAAANPPAVLKLIALAHRAEHPSGWISVEDERKPALGEMVLMHVRTLMRGDMGDFGEVEGEGYEIALGEYVAGRSKDDADYFSCYTSPMSDSDWITHWMPLPPAPDASSLLAGSAREGGNTNAETIPAAQPAADPAPVPAQGIDHAKRAEGADAAFEAWWAQTVAVNGGESVGMDCKHWARHAWQARGQQAGVPEGFVSAVREMVANDGGEGSRYNAQALIKARDSVKAMLAVVPGEAG